jgi:hypothetical protein
MRLLRGVLLSAAFGSAIGTGAAPTVELVFCGLVLTILFVVFATLVPVRPSGALSAARTPTNPPAPARLVPLGHGGGGEEVQDQVGGWRPWCRCGWEGGRCNTPEEADAELAGHLEQL